MSKKRIELPETHTATEFLRGQASRIFDDVANYFEEIRDIPTCRANASVAKKFKCCRNDRMLQKT